MSDLIDTPRDRGNFEKLARQADKIERLTAEITRIEISYEDICEGLNMRITKLEAENAGLIADCDMWKERVAELEAE